MKLSPKAGVWLITLLWIGVIAGLWAKNEYQVRNAQEVILKTVPVDPRDLFRGDYVRLRYEISRLDLDRLSQGNTDFKQNGLIFVNLKKENDVWKAESASSQKPKKGIFLKGRIRWISNGQADVEYGIESYFVPEGEGLEIEKKAAQGEVKVVVSVSSSGNSILKGVILE